MNTQELEEILSSRASRLSVLTALVDHSGWAVFQRLLVEQQESRKGEVLLRPLASANDIYSQEFYKGEISGLAIAQVSVYAVIETLKADLKVTTAQLEREHELETTEADGQGRSRVDGRDWHRDDSIDID